MTKFELAGNLIEEGRSPAEAFAEAKLTYSELKDFQAHHCATARIGDVSVILLETWLKVLPQGAKFESDAGNFAEARRVLDLERRIRQELLRRG